MISETFNIDCIEGMKQYPDKYFDLAVVDPPYGINMAMGHKGSEKRKDKNKYKSFDGNDNSIPNKMYFDELFRVSKNQIIWGANYMIEFLHPTSCFIVWDKVQPEDFSMAMCEFAWTSFKSPAKIFQKRIVGADDLRIHPTQKPVTLYDWILKNYAKEEICVHKHTKEYDWLCTECKERPNFKVLDTHLDSQSSRISAWKAKLDFVGFETDIDYFQQGNKRFEDFKKQLTLF